jgi:O-antigen ligase
MLTLFFINDPWFLAILGLIAAFIIVKGRIDLALGAHLSVMYWSYNLQVGRWLLMWATLVVLGCTLIAHWIRKPGWPRWDRRAVGSLMLLIMWLALVFFGYLRVASPTLRTVNVMKAFVLNAVVPLVVILSGITAWRQVSGLCSAFVLSTIVSGALGVGLPGLVDPFLPTSGPGGLAAENYLSFAVPFAIACLMLIDMLNSSKSVLRSSILTLALSYCAVCLLSTGARQHLGGVLAGLAVFSVQRGLRRRKWLILWIPLTVFIAWTLVSDVNIGKELLPEKFGRMEDSFQGRRDYWQDGFRAFLAHPIGGAGMDYFADGDTAHNYIIDLLASEGLLGLLCFGCLVVQLLAILNVRRKVWTMERYWALLAAVSVYTLVHTQMSGAVASEYQVFWGLGLVFQMRAIPGPTLTESHGQVLDRGQTTGPICVPHYARK